MVPFSDAGRSGIFRLIHADVAPYSPTLHGVEPSGHARSVTSESTECDSDRISKIRARQCTCNKQGYKTICGFNRLAPTVRPTSGRQKSGSRPPCPPRILSLSGPRGPDLIGSTRVTGYSERPEWPRAYWALARRPTRSHAVTGSHATQTHIHAAGALRAFSA